MPGPPATDATTDGAKTDGATTPGYSRARARTRGTLLAAAREVMADKGAEGATIADIAHRADVSPGTFYNYFDDLPAVLDALVDDLLDRFDSAMAGLVGIEATPAQRFALGIDRILRMADEDPVWSWCMIRFESTVERMRDALNERATANLRSGARAGLYAPGFNEVAVADVLIGTLITSGLSRLRGRADSSDNQRVAEVLLRALGVPADEARAAVEILRTDAERPPGNPPAPSGGSPG